MSEADRQPSEADRILGNLRSLRQEIIDAWSARGVILTPEEREALREEIQLTCELLSGLAPSKPRRV